MNETTLTTRDPSKADQKDFTSNPLTRAPANKNSRALMTSKNRPSVTICQGKREHHQNGLQKRIENSQYSRSDYGCPRARYSDSGNEISGQEYGYGSDKPSYEKT